MSLPSDQAAPSGWAWERSIQALSLFVVAAIVGWTTTATAEIRFGEVTAAAGLDGEVYGSTHDHGMGAAWIDYNNDGLPDLFVVNGKGRTAGLYRNEGGSFTNVSSLLPTLPDVEMMGVVFADYDNDGDSDLYVFTDNEFAILQSELNPQDGPYNLLLKNLWVESGEQEVEPLFEEVAEAAGLADAADPPLGVDYDGHRAATGNWVDYDRDGHVDLVVGHWVTAHGGEVSNRNRLYRNLGDGTFADVSDATGVEDDLEPLNFRPTLTSIAAHLDGDLWPDIYFGNNQGAPPLHHDRLLSNNADGTFSDTTSASAGIGDDASSAMGLAVADIELDGDFDLYVSDSINDPQSQPPAGNVLYINQGDGTFLDNTADIAGVSADSSWGVNFFDADHDGYEDLFVGTVGMADNRFYRNEGDGTFSDLTNTAGAANSIEARGTAVADFDADGDLDILVVNTDPAGHPLQLFANRTTEPGHWLQIDLEGVESNRDVIGGLVKVSAGGREMMRQVLGGSSAHSQNELVLHFGLGEATHADSVEIHWPTGVVQNLGRIPGDRKIYVREGFSISTLEPAIAGVSNVLRMTGASADGGIRIMAGSIEGSFVIDRCDGAVGQVEDPIALPNAFADADGNAVVRLDVPPDVSGDTVLFQALDVTTCTVSNLVTVSFP